MNTGEQALMKSFFEVNQIQKVKFQISQFQVRFPAYVLASIIVPTDKAFCEQKRYERKIKLLPSLIERKTLPQFSMKNTTLSLFSI